MLPSNNSSLELWLSELELRQQRFERDALFLLTASERRCWWAEIIENADNANRIMRNALSAEDNRGPGCVEVGTPSVRRVSIKTQQIYLYQLVYWVGNAIVPNADDVVRHMCHNRRCINPMHLEHGTQGQNIHDTRERV